jgi:excisionase family DNA binding protein
MTQKWLTLAQACAYTGRSPTTLKRKAQAGEIVGHKPQGSQWQFDRESIDAFYTPPINKRAFDIVRSLRK